ncbi:hypothetical protein DGWBC_0882 [Dehalogenimonas sp. WBC-2]|nr:hypothetical protein DGWBC_0882 [Dehalogenimonas sp. WBC-2]
MKLLVRSIFLFLLVGLLLPTHVVQAIPPIAEQYYGSVSLDGSAAPDGTGVSAQMNGREAGSGSTSGGTYSLTINTIEGDQAGNSISFFVNGLSAGSSSLSPGGITSLDLSATTPIPTFSLTIQISGSGSTSPSAGYHTYNENTTVDISATASSGWVFDSWSGGVVDPSSPNTSILLDSNKTITASFLELPPGPTYNLTMQITGQGTVNPSVGSHQYAENSDVTISAVPAEGWRFDSWTGDVTAAKNATTSVSMNQDKTVVANFVLLVDETPPVMSGVQVINITKTSAVVTWTTNERATSIVNYSPGTLNVTDTALVTAHSVALSGLKPATTYTLSVSSSDGVGNKSTSEGHTFTTIGSPATFEVTDLRFDLVDTADGGKTINVEFVVSNVGDVAGTYETELLINNLSANTKQTVVNPGSSEVVKLTSTQTTPGNYIARVGSLTFTFNIIEGNENIEPDGFSWLPIGIVILVVLAIAIAFLLLSRKYYFLIFAPKE